MHLLTAAPPIAASDEATVAAAAIGIAVGVLTSQATKWQAGRQAKTAIQDRFANFQMSKREPYGQLLNAAWALKEGDGDDGDLRRDFRAKRAQVLAYGDDELRRYLLTLDADPTGIDEQWETLIAALLWDIQWGNNSAKRKSEFPARQTA